MDLSRRQVLAAVACGALVGVPASAEAAEDNRLLEQFRRAGTRVLHGSGLLFRPARWLRWSVHAPTFAQAFRGQRGALEDTVRQLLLHRHAPDLFIPGTHAPAWLVISPSEFSAKFDRARGAVSLTVRAQVTLGGPSVADAPRLASSPDRLRESFGEPRGFTAAPRFSFDPVYERWEPEYADEAVDVLMAAYLGSDFPLRRPPRPRSRDEAHWLCLLRNMRDHGGGYGRKSFRVEPLPKDLA